MYIGIESVCSCSKLFAVWISSLLVFTGPGEFCQGYTKIAKLLMCTIVKRERKNQKNRDNISFLNNDKSEQLIASIGKLLQSKVEEQKKEY